MGMFKNYCIDSFSNLEELFTSGYRSKNKKYDSMNHLFDIFDAEPDYYEYFYESIESGSILNVFNNPAEFDIFNNELEEMLAEKKAEQSEETFDEMMKKIDDLMDDKPDEKKHFEDEESE